MSHISLRQPLFWSVLAHVLVGTLIGNTLFTSDRWSGGVPTPLAARIVKLSEAGTPETTRGLRHVEPVVPGPSLATRSFATAGSPVVTASHAPSVTEANVAAVLGSESIRHGPSPQQNVPTDGSVETNAEGVREYRLNLGRAAAPFKKYPAVARDRGWEGVVVVQLNALAGSPLPVVALGRSSGHGALDEQALEMIRRAVEVAVLPDSLRGHAFGLELPIQYSLRD